MELPGLPQVTLEKNESQLERFNILIEGEYIGTATTGPQLFPKYEVALYEKSGPSRVTLEFIGRGITLELAITNAMQKAILKNSEEQIAIGIARMKLEKAGFVCE